MSEINLQVYRLLDIKVKEYVPSPKFVEKEDGGFTFALTAGPDDDYSDDYTDDQNISKSSPAQNQKKTNPYASLSDKKNDRRYETPAQHSNSPNKENKGTPGRMSNIFKTDN